MVDEWHRDDIRADLALALMQHPSMLRDAGRDADSLPGFVEAIGLLRPLLAKIAGGIPLTCARRSACSRRQPPGTATLSKPWPRRGRLSIWDIANR